jgi:hypothetical protein
MLTERTIAVLKEIDKEIEVHDPVKWEFWMYKMGWGEVLNYIGVGWETEVEKQGQLIK